MPESLRTAAERLMRHYPKTSLNPDAMLALDVLAVRDALKREPESEAAVERLCRDALDAAEVLDDPEAAQELRDAVAAVRGREESKDA